MTSKKTQETADLLRSDLLEQLKRAGKEGEQFIDQVDDYVYLYILKSRLKSDISKNALRIKTTTGNGFESAKTNDSIQNILKVSAQMLKILSTLGVTDPVEKKKNDSNGYLP